MTSRPSLNTLCHCNTCVHDKVDSLKHFCSIFNDSAAMIPLEIQNFVVKIARQAFRLVNEQLPNAH